MTDKHKTILEGKVSECRREGGKYSLESNGNHMCFYTPLCFNKPHTSCPQHKTIRLYDKSGVFIECGYKHK